MEFGKSSWLEKNATSLVLVLGLLLVLLIGLLVYGVFSRGFMESDASKNIGKETASNQQNSTVDKIVKGSATSDETVEPNAPRVQIVSNNPSVESLINKVFKHVFLPSGDVQVQTVVKPDELRKANPVFYQYAREGDYILVYKDRVILYNPVADRVIDILHVDAVATK